MRRLLSLLILALLVFYGAWPAYSGYTIKTALESKDAALLSSKVDFPSVRESMRPAVTAKVEAALTKVLEKAGQGGGALIDKMKARLMPKIVDAALAKLVEPETLIRIYAERGRIKDGIDRIIAEKVSAGSAGGDLGAVLGNSEMEGAGGASGGGGGGLLGNLGKAAEQLGIDPEKVLGGLIGKKDESKAAEEPAKSGEGPKYGLANVKRFGLNGPLAIALGVAKDPVAAEPDLTAEMSFTGNDWKLTGLVPRI
jgi:hypothetical protein